LGLGLGLGLSFVKAFEQDSHEGYLFLPAPMQRTKRQIALRGTVVKKRMERDGGG